MINGSQLRDMLICGERNLSIHRNEINDLNVFPVPDGDTGTNMYMTYHSGIHAISALSDDAVSVLAPAFSSAVTLFARGNSGVILSQFLRGFMDVLKDGNGVGSSDFLTAMESGVVKAYESVAKPVEGTMLTVLREGTEALRGRSGRGDSLETSLEIFLNAARISLQNTPNLLKILKDANVVDSGGAGVVYLFEGFLGYLRGGVYPEDDPTEHEAPAPLNMDFSAFGPDSRFPYGYCTELLIQLLNECAPFDLSSFRRRLEELGESVAVTESDGKVKVHVHTPNPEQILAYCHPFGEFLHLKIENMSVQHSNADGIAGSEAAPGPGGTKPVSKPCVKKVEEPFGVVAVAPDEVMAKLFEDMGADAVITCKGNPSSNDYLEAFRTLDAESILVFPNHPNSILAAYNAAELYEDARVYVVESKSVAHCYAILPMLDYTEIDVESAMECAEETISRIEFASVVRAQKDSRYGDRDIKFGDYIALRSKDLLAVGSELGDVAVDAIRLILADRPTDVITVFCGQSISADSLDEVFNQLRKEFLFVEIQTVHTADALTDLLISFE